jgi:hypothetical protein
MPIHVRTQKCGNKKRGGIGEEVDAAAFYRPSREEERRA